MTIGSSTIGVVRSTIAQMLGYSHDRRRNLYEQFGYRRELRYDDFEAMYYRNDIANRIVRAFPQATWRDAPVIRDEAGDDPSESRFVAAWEDLAEEMRVAHYLERADRMAGIGQFSVLVMGLADGKPPSEPVEGQSPLVYLAPYKEGNITINAWDLDETSPRFGLPLSYTVQRGSPIAGGATVTRSITVHWSRVIHVAEITQDDEVYGLPRLMPVFNRLMDLEKVMGSGAETFWLNARPGMAIKADKDADLSAEAIADMKEQAQDFEHQLRRILALQGVEVQTLQATVADPRPIIEMLIQVIAGAVGIPQRILVGTERGELASTQDENNWQARIAERRSNWASPMMLRPFISAMIATGNLPEPQGEWWIEWPEGSPSPQIEAEVARTRAQAIAAYANALGGEMIVPPEEFRPWLGLEPVSEFDPPAVDDLPEEDPDVEAQFNRSRGRDIPLRAVQR